MNEEKRRFTRVPFKMEARLNVNDQSYHIREIANLSVGGCLAYIDETLPAGTKCRLVIDLGGPESDALLVEMDGEIIRSGQASVAVKFIGIELESLMHLQNIIRYNSSDADAIEKEVRNNFGL